MLWGRNAKRGKARDVRQNEGNRMKKGRRRRRRRRRERRETLQARDRLGKNMIMIRRNW